MYHGKTWDNSTHTNFRESELHKVADWCKEVIATDRVNRKELFLAEKAERALYPRKTTLKFGNVELTAIETMAYTDSRHSVSGYPLIGKKHITVYANGKPYRYGMGLEYDKDFLITKDWLIGFAATHYVAQYNVNDLNDSSTIYVDTVSYKQKGNFVPYHFYIGYVIELNGKQYNVTDAIARSYFTGFRTDKGDIECSPTDLQKIKVIGEMQGINALSALMAKTKYME
jgi:hypothetical protein